MKFRGHLSALLIAMSFLQGCGEEGVEANTVDKPATNPEIWPSVTSSIKLSPEVEQRVAALLAKLSLEEKVGQLIQPEIKFITPAQVKQYHIGSVLNGGGTAPNNDKFAAASEWVALANEYYHASSQGNSAGIPLIWGSDAVHGHNNVVGATLFPHNIGLGAARDPEMIARIGAATAAEVAVTGIDWTFAPTVAVVRDDRWGRTYESYSEDPEIVSAYAKAMVEGIQGKDSMVLGSRQLVATTKHFLGDGGTFRGIDRGDTQVTEQELHDIHAAGFIASLEAGVQTVMASFNSWNGVKMHGNAYLLNDILKERMGFDGFVVGDWNGHRQIPGCSVESCAHAINAGLDMFMVPSDWLPLYNNTLAQAKSGEISMARIDDAVTRILRVKVRAGLMDQGEVSGREMSAKAGVMGSDAHRALAREAVRKSLVLLKNNQSLLPLSPTQNILVAGDGADDIGKQSGGWTLSWQGTGNQLSDFPGASSIFSGIQQAVNAGGGKVTFSEEGSFEQKPDVAIVVIGEDPYAEWHGDRSSIEYQVGVKSDLALLQSLKAQGIPVVTVFLSGRPLWVNKEINSSDAFVAAWLPGSEGGGIADVLFTSPEGEVQYDFAGRLSFSWPKYVHQTVINLGDEGYDPLFPYGYGMNYKEAVELLGAFPEENTLPPNGDVDDSWLFVSRTLAPWALKVQSGAADNIVDADGNKVSSGDNNNLMLSSIDKVSQEDAREIQWLGLEPATVYLEANNPQDLSIFGERKGHLEFSLNVGEYPSESVALGMDCGPNCEVAIAAEGILQSQPINQWQTVSLPLDCLMQRGLNLSQVIRPFSLSTKGSLKLAIADLKIVPEFRNLKDMPESVSAAPSESACEFNVAADANV